MRRPVAQLNLSRGARRRPRSQRGSGTGSSIVSTKTLWSDARSSRFGRSNGSRNSCHGCLAGGAGRCGGGAGAGGVLRTLIAPAIVPQPRADGNGSGGLQRGAPQREPAAEVLLHGQVALELGL